MAATIGPLADITRRKFGYRWAWTLVAVIVVCMASCTSPRTKRDKIKIGYLLCNSEQETAQRFIPLNRHLTEKTGIDCEFVPVEPHDLERRFDSGEFAVVRTNSLLYTRLREKSGAQLLAAEKRGNMGAFTAGTIITRKGSGIDDIAALAGKTLAFGSTFAPAGYLVEYDMLLSHGLDPEQDLGHYTTPRGSFKHEKLVYGALSGAYDAAAVPLLDLEIMTREGKISADDLVIIATSAPIPYCTFASSRSIDPGIATKIRRALVDLKDTDTVAVDGEVRNVLKSARVDGYTELTEQAYEPVRAMDGRITGHQLR
jgi:phosphonate transport system substrate-binding protein